MPALVPGHAPNLAAFKSSMRSRSDSIETSIDSLILLLKRHQVRGSRDCAEATALLLRRMVENSEASDVSELMDSVQHIGQRLVTAAPRELAVGNIVRRVLGLIREEAEEDRAARSVVRSETSLGNLNHSTKSTSLRKVANRRAPGFNTGIAGHEAVLTSTPTGKPVFGSLSKTTSHADLPSGTPDSLSIAGSHPQSGSTSLDTARELQAEVVEGILEIIEELKQADEQIAGYASEHIHSNEIILVYGCSETVRKFLLKAASKRKFTVIHAENYPNGHETTYAQATGEKNKVSEDKQPGHYQKTLTSAGIPVVLIPDSAIFAVMSRANKVILDSHIVFANGGLIGVAGAKQIAKAARAHRTPVIFLSGIYKFSPVYPFNVGMFLEEGDPSNVIPYEEGEFMDKVEVENPLFDYVPPELIDLYVTNLGGHAPSYLHRIIADHYRSEDIDLSKLEPR